MKIHTKNVANELLFTAQICTNRLSAGASPQTPLRGSQRSPQTPSGSGGGGRVLGERKKKGREKGKGRKRRKRGGEGGREKREEGRMGGDVPRSQKRADSLVWIIHLAAHQMSHRGVL